MKEKIIEIIGYARVNSLMAKMAETSMKGRVKK
jgi:hypothetical protein